MSKLFIKICRFFNDICICHKCKREISGYEYRKNDRKYHLGYCNKCIEQLGEKEKWK